MMVFYTTSSIVGSTFIDRFPRRVLVIMFGVISNVFLALFAIFSVTYQFHWMLKYLALGSLYGYIISFG